jgi:hypothetical protein
MFKILNSVVERWLSLKTRHAIDERAMVEKYIRLSNFINSSEFNVEYWQKSLKRIYKYYTLGEFKYAEDDFYESIRYSISSAYEVIPKENLPVLSDGAFHPPPTKDIQKLFTKKELKNIEKDALKSIKVYILINEAARKLKLKYIDDGNEWRQSMKNLAVRKNNNKTNEIRNNLKRSDDIQNLNLRDESLHDNKSSETNNHENIFCKGIDMNFVKKHFSVLTERVSKNNKKPFLTNEQLNDFINAGFWGHPLKEKITINKSIRGEKQLIVKLFYDFFNSTSRDYFEGYNRDKYIKLLSDNFVDFDFDVLKNNFLPKTKKSIHDMDKYNP